MRRFTSVLLLVIALGCGFAASQALASLPEEKDAQPDANNAPDLVTVLVAKKNLPVGTVIKEPEKYFEVKKVGRKAAPEGGFQRLAEITNLKLRKPIGAGTIFTEDFVHDAKSLLEEATPPGQIAVTAPILQDGLWGCWRPMSKVDLILTDPKENGERKGHVIMRNVLMLALDVRAGGGDSVANKLVIYATFALDPGQDDQLMEALSEGKLSVRCSHSDE